MTATWLIASAFAHLAAVGRAHDDEAARRHEVSLSASRLMVMAEQLQAAGRLELAGDYRHMWEAKPRWQGL